MTNVRRFLTTACLVALAALLGAGGCVLTNFGGADDSDRLESAREVKAIQLDRREVAIRPVAIRVTPQFPSFEEWANHTHAAPSLRSPDLFFDRIVHQQQMRK